MLLLLYTVIISIRSAKRYILCVQLDGSGIEMAPYMADRNMPQQCHMAAR